MSSRPQFVDTEAQARERKAAYDHERRYPTDPADAVELLVAAGYGTREGLSAALDGKPETAINLPAAENLRAPNLKTALGVITSHRSAVSRQAPVPVPEPVFSMPDPDGDISMSDLTRRGPLFVRQFQTKFPEAYARLEAADRRRMAGPPVR